MCVPTGELVGIRMHSCVHVYMLLRDAEGRKKEVSKVIQTIRQSHSTHKAVTFSKEK